MLALGWQDAHVTVFRLVKRVGAGRVATMTWGGPATQGVCGNILGGAPGTAPEAGSPVPLPLNRLPD